MPDWNMAIAPDIGANVMNSFRQGQQERMQSDGRNALAAYATDPNADSLNALAQYDPQFVMQQKQAQQGQMAAQQKQHQEQIVLMGKLLDQANDPASYQQALSAAKMYGLDTTQAPPQYDPQWVGQMRTLVRASQHDNGQSISGIARELMDAGYKPNTPEFEQAMVGVINNKYASEYIDQGGNTRRRPALNMPGQQGQQGPQPGAVVGGYRFKGGNPNDQASWEPAGGPTQPASGDFQR